MPTIGNMPHADVLVGFESGRIEVVNILRVLVHTQNAEFKAQHGMFLPSVGKLHPTVRALREEYGITAKTWKDAAEQMRQLYNTLSEGRLDG